MVTLSNFNPFFDFQCNTPPTKNKTKNTTLAPAEMISFITDK